MRLTKLGIIFNTLSSLCLLLYLFLYSWAANSPRDLVPSPPGSGGRAESSLTSLSSGAQFTQVNLLHKRQVSYTPSSVPFQISTYTLKFIFIEGLLWSRPITSHQGSLPIGPPPNHNWKIWRAPWAPKTTSDFIVRVFFSSKDEEEMTTGQFGKSGKVD